MSGALVRVLATARPLRRRLAFGVALGALAVGAGVALMSTSGYLISRAALRPPILSLAVAIVGVQFFGLSRGVLRYFERLASHDAALRLLDRMRAAFFERLEPLVPDGLPLGARTGDLLGRFVDDVDELQHVFVRALGPPIVAIVVGLGAVVAALLVDPRCGGRARARAARGRRARAARRGARRPLDRPPRGARARGAPHRRARGARVRAASSRSTAVAARRSRSSPPASRR